LEPRRCLDLSYEHLAEADIKKLNTLCKKNKLKFSNISVKQTMPFAPFLFVGVLLTFLIRGDVITYLKLLVLSLT